MKKYENVFITTTDTVTGIGIPMKEGNDDLIYELKKRPREKKIIIVVGNIEQARTLKGWNEKAETMAKEYWPGAVTLSLNEDIAVRMPNQDGLLRLLNEIGPCYLSSANKAGEEAINIKDAKKFFPEVDNIYNFGEGNGKPSRIIRVEDGKVLR